MWKFFVLDLLLFEILISDPDDEVECLLFEICCCPVYWETQHWKSKHTLDQCCAGSLYIIFDPIIGLQQSYSLLIRQRTNWRCWQSSWRSWRSRLNTQQVRKNAPKSNEIVFFGPPAYNIYFETQSHSVHWLSSPIFPCSSPWSLLLVMLLVKLTISVNKMRFRGVRGVTFCDILAQTCP